MAPICIPTLGHALNSLEPTRGMPEKQIESLSQLNFDGESNISTLNHIDGFVNRCKYFNIIVDNEICRLFTLTFIGQIRKWFLVLPENSIHSWKHFCQVFLKTHQNYSYNGLCLELDNLYMYDNESLDDFYNTFWSFCYRFHLDYFPSTEDLIERFTSLISSHFEDNESIN